MHLLFDNEKRYLESLFSNCQYIKFADFLSDDEMQACDKDAYSEEQQNTAEYYDVIKQLKNNIVIRKVLDKYKNIKGYICSDNLGIYEKLWLDAGFERLECEYYYVSVIKATVSDSKEVSTQKAKKPKFKEVYVAEQNGKKYIFIGNLNRIGYRTELDFEKSDYECERLNNREFYTSEQCQYLTTLHEMHKCKVPDEPQYDGKRQTTRLNYHLTLCHTIKNLKTLFSFCSFYRGGKNLWTSVHMKFANNAGKISSVSACKDPKV